MHLDPLLPSMVGVILIILSLGLFLQAFRQPQMIAYLLAGVVIGPGGLALVTDVELIGHLGAMGVTLLLFFIGMEVSAGQLVRGWRVAVIGTLFQIAVSVGCVWLIGSWLDWGMPRIILLGFVISLSSTALVLKLLKDRGELKTRAGENVLLILLAQDFAVVPMLIGISFLAGTRPDSLVIAEQLVGGVAVLGLAAYLLSREHITLPFLKQIRQDHELQVFAALLLCFGLAFITAILGLSSALGAFIAGMVVATARETEWVHHSLEPMRVVFVALLFVSVGMLIDVEFFLGHWGLILLLVVAVLITNTFINAGIIRLLGSNWRDSLYSGALLAQVGEFSFVLASVGLQANIIQGFAYQLTIAVIAISLLFSPGWIAMFKKLAKPG